MANTPTREHRFAAAAARCGDWAIDSPVNDWVRTGDIQGVPSRETQRELVRTAQALCDADQRAFERGRAAERSEVVAYLRQYPSDYDYAAAIESGKHLAKEE